MDPNTVSRVIVIGWDGAGNFVQDAHTPYLDRFVRSGTFGFDARTVMPTISAQCWGALLHGASPENHALTKDIAAAAKYPDDSPYPSIFRVVREAMPSAKLASFCTWNPINYGIIESSIGVHKETVPPAVTKASRLQSPDDAARSLDRAIASAAAAYLRGNPDVKLMFVALDGPDAAGHRHGYNTPAQLRAIEAADEHTGLIVQALEETGMLSDSLLIFVTDHGGGGDEGARDHGSDHPLDRTIFWGCSGPGIAAGAALEDGFVIMDTAAVVVHALGLVAPASWEAKLPDRLFVMEEAEG
jgi:hypothetical protein